MNASFRCLVSGCLDCDWDTVHVARFCFSLTLVCFHIERGRVLEIVDAIYRELDLVVCCRTGVSESMATIEFVFSQLVRL